MILETHGDTCRLGYLRPLACLLEDESPKSFDFLASILYDLVRNVEDYELLPHRPIGLITRSVNARNYVTLAAEMELIDRKTQTLGRFGKIYLTMDSAGKFREMVEGRAILSLRDLITLSDAEKFFFLWVILTTDYPFIQPILAWAVEKERFTRQEAMNYIMEEVYPTALKKILSSLPSRRREQIAREVAEAEKFREKRTSIQNKTDWIKSSQYAKYRHIAPPRLEWLVDVGVLARRGRGKYEVEEPFIRNIETVLRIVGFTPKRMEEHLFNDLPKLIYRSMKTASMYEVSKTLVEAYERVRGGEGVSLSLLERVTVLLLMDRGKIADLRMVHDAFNSLALRFPDKIYVAPGAGKTINIAYMNLSETEI